MLTLVLRRAWRQLVGASLVFTLIAATGLRPSSPQYGRPLPGLPRYDDSAVLDPATDRIYIFGGLAYTQDGNLELVKELWSYDIGRDAWTNLTSESGPSARSGCAAAWDPSRRRLLVSAGTTLAEGCAGDLWSYSPRASTWRALADLPQKVFLARRYHTLTYDPSRDLFWLVCGLCIDEPYRNFAPYDPADDSWGILRAIPGTYGYRIRHCAVWDPLRSRLLVYGGEIPGIGLRPEQLLNWMKVWAVDPATDSWTALPDGADQPLRRSWFVSGYDPYLDAMIVYGGVSFASLPDPHPTVTGELWAYLLDRGQWVRLDDGELPPRAAAAGAYCPSLGQFITFGGLSTDPFAPGTKEIHNETIVIPVEIPARFHWIGRGSGRSADSARTACIQLPDASAGLSGVRLLNASSGQVLSVANSALRLGPRTWRVTFPPVSQEELKVGATGHLVISGLLSQGSRAFLAPVARPSRDETWVKEDPSGGSTETLAGPGLRVLCQRGPSGWEVLVSGATIEPSVVVVDVRGRLVRHLERGSPVASADNSFIWRGQSSEVQGLQPGIYFVQARSAGRTASAKIVVE